MPNNALRIILRFAASQRLRSSGFSYKKWIQRFRSMKSMVWCMAERVILPPEMTHSGILGLISAKKSPQLDT
jgi:hypothetical protein